MRTVHPDRPMFVVVEGLPGCLTSEVATAVAAEFGQAMMNPPWTAMPVVRRALEREYEECPQGALLYDVSRALSLRSVLEGDLRDGRMVVMDRYVLSAVVRHTVRGAAESLDNVIGQALSAHVTYYLHAPLMVRRDRIDRARRDDPGGARWTLDPGCDAALDTAYRAHTRHPIAGHFVAVDAAQSTGDIVAWVIADILARAAPDWRRTHQFEI